MANPNPKPVQTAVDLAWLEARTVDALPHASRRRSWCPDRDAAGLKAVVIAVETGFGPMRMPGYVTPDGSRFLSGMLWDFQMDPREERKKRIDLSQGRFEGKPDGAITMVEYADMECGYCRFRGLQMDQLLEANPKLSYKRYYKFFPLWFSHAWSMKAASAADCIFRFAKGPAMFEFKKQVYAQQAVMTVVRDRRARPDLRRGRRDSARRLPELLPARREPGRRPQGHRRGPAPGRQVHARPTSSTGPRSPGSRTR